MPHEFEVNQEIALDASPERVWEAIATGPGVDAWFMGRNEIEPREGGAMRMTMGDGAETATITTWDPPHRLAFRGAANPDGTFMAFEYLVEGRDGGTSVLRLVHSGFLGDDWEAEYDALNEGWRMYLHQLGEYLTHFPGRTATPVSAMQSQAGDRERASTVLRAGLGLTAPVREGERVSLTPAGLAPIEGVVDYLSPNFLGVRGDDALYRFICAPGGMVAVGHHLYADDVDGKEAESAWQSWLTGLFAAGLSTKD